jgi:hypothetical protein
MVLNDGVADTFASAMAPHRKGCRQCPVRAALVNGPTSGRKVGKRERRRPSRLQKDTAIRFSAWVHFMPIGL